MQPNSTPSPVPSQPADQPDVEPATASVSPNHQAAAANVVRNQIDTVYNQTATESSAESPYHRTHQESTHPTPEQWQQYHSAWQDYYQKYYERYYVGHIHQARQAIAAQNAAPAQRVIGSANNESLELDKDDAMFELRNQLLGTVQKKAKEVRKSRHFIPIAAAFGVMLIFGFLQYNQLLIANVQAYISPGAIDPKNIIVDPSMPTTVDPASTNIVIPKINVDVPVDYNAKPDHDSQMAAMKNGLAYFGIAGASSKPGQVGNTPVAGHSSNDVLETGNYKFIFAQLDKVGVGDTVYANYQGTRYTYVVTKKEVVLPTEVTRLVYATDKPILTLITCTPLGTAQKRLLVTAEQINPSPASASKPDTTNTTTTVPEMTGTAPTFFERLFGAS